MSNTQRTTSTQPDAPKPDNFADGTKSDQNKTEDTRWKSDAAKRAYASDEDFDLDSSEGDPNIPMTVHTEPYTDGNGVAKSRTYRVPTADFTEFQQAREARLKGE